MDIFEQKSGFYDVIILQTVLDELRNRSLPLYNRVIALTRSDDKHFYVFFNDFRLETYVVREPGETINDRNDRAVRRAVSWYREHLHNSLSISNKSNQCPAVLMLSDDKENLRKAKAENLNACSLTTYVSGLEDADSLLDMITASRQIQESRTSAAEQFYPNYLPLPKIMTGLELAFFIRAYLMSLRIITWRVLFTFLLLTSPFLFLAARIVTELFREIL